VTLTAGKDYFNNILKLLRNFYLVNRMGHCGRHRPEPRTADIRLLDRATSVTDENNMTIRPVTTVFIALAILGTTTGAQAQHCHREGMDVACDDGRHGVWSADAIIWPDGSQSHVSSHPSVVIGNKSSITIGPGVFVGQGKGMVPLDDPNKTRCVTVDDVPYCN
jgi:hypothetical protein